MLTHEEAGRAQLLCAAAVQKNIITYPQQNIQHGSALILVWGVILQEDITCVLISCVVENPISGVVETADIIRC